MAGIKHGKWNMDPNNPRTPRPSIDDELAMAEWAARDVVTHCKICGNQIALTGQSSEQWQEELKMSMHKECFINYMYAQAQR